MAALGMSVSATELVVIRRHLDEAGCRTLRDASSRLSLQWRRGRQGSGYDKASLLDHLADFNVGIAVEALNARLGHPAAIDAWWIVYPPGSGVPAHTDPAPVDGFVHLRANLVVSAGDAGGVFVANGKGVDLDVGDLVVFRPDRVEHAVTLVVGGARHVLSVGTIWSEDDARAVFAALAVAQPIGPA